MMKRLVCGPLIGALVLANAAHAQAPAQATAPAPAPAETTVEDVTVVGGKIAPTTDDPKTATCEFLVATDLGAQAQLGAAIAGGSSVLGPQMLQPTRFPRNVDFRSAPLSTPGSALPQIARQYRGVTTRSASDAETGSAPPEQLFGMDRPATNFEGSDGEVDLASASEFTRDNAIAACRSFQTAGGSPNVFSQGAGRSTIYSGSEWGAGKFEAAYRDKDMPTAFALFEEHRYAESLEYFERAFNKLSYEHGGDEAALMIGKLMLGAPGVEADMAKAVTWLKKAAGARFDPATNMPQFDPREPERNTAIGEAAMILGYLYQAGVPGLAKDSAEARKHFDRARKVGHVRACLVLGDIYYFGLDTPRDMKKAFNYYKEGAGFGDAPAQQALAEMYYAGEAPTGRDLKLAAAWHNEAAKIGHAPSLFALAVAYEDGEGVTANPERALGLYKLAAMAGSPPARNAIGSYFYAGRMLPKDPVVARRWFQQAAQDGDPDAMFNLGAMLMKGEGGEVDRTRAWAWLKIAQSSEHPQALAAVNVLEARMTPEEKAAAAKLIAPKRS